MTTEIATVMVTVQGSPIKGGGRGESRQVAAARAWEGGPLRVVPTRPGDLSSYACEECMRAVSGVYWQESDGRWLGDCCKFKPEPCPKRQASAKKAAATKLAKRNAS
jgi:hypothetical protein